MLALGVAIAVICAVGIVAVIAHHIYTLQVEIIELNRKIKARRK